MHKATFGVGRGVWVAPWKGENGETILVAIRRDSRIVARRELAADEDRIAAGDELWATLDREDPAPMLRAI